MIMRTIPEQNRGSHLDSRKVKIHLDEKMDVGR